MVTPRGLTLLLYVIAQQACWRQRTEAELAELYTYNYIHHAQCISSSVDNMRLELISHERRHMHDHEVRMKKLRGSSRSPGSVARQSSRQDTFSGSLQSASKACLRLLSCGISCSLLLR